MTDVHCKDIDHLAIRVVPARATDKITVSYLAPMGCHNQPVSEPWGLVLSKRVKEPLKGIHARPAAVRWLPGELRRASAECDSAHVVEIAHTVGGLFEHFACLTRDGALILADRIEVETAATGH